MDAMTLDIVAMLFDQLFDDPRSRSARRASSAACRSRCSRSRSRTRTCSRRRPPGAHAARHAGRDRRSACPPISTPASTLFGHLETIIAGADRRLQGRRRDLRHRARAARRSWRARTSASRRNAAAAERVLQEGGARGGEERGAAGDPRAREGAPRCRGAVLEFLVEQWIKLMMLIHVKRGTAAAMPGSPRSRPWTS